MMRHHHSKINMKKAKITIKNMGIDGKKSQEQFFNLLNAIDILEESMGVEKLGDLISFEIGDYVTFKNFNVDVSLYDKKSRIYQFCELVHEIQTKST